MEPIDIDELRASVVKQGGLVRQLKKDGAAQEEVTAGMFFVLCMVICSCEEAPRVESAVGS